MSETWKMNAAISKTVCFKDGEIHDQRGTICDETEEEVLHRSR